MNEDSHQASLLGPGLLVLATIMGFVLSNTSLAEIYHYFLTSKVNFSIGSWAVLNKSILHLVNDGLMAVFFLFIGLELKREILVGELSELRKAMLPIFSALGGIFLPALIYFCFNPSGPMSKGWAIPMATDIAFALGILAVLGSRVPASLKVLLAAIAIVDDLGAILVIAAFYTSSIDYMSLLVAACFLSGCIVTNRSNVMKLSVYILFGIPLWYFMLKSGIHATIAGVLLAFTIPMASKRMNRAKLLTDILNKEASPLDSPAVFMEKSLVKWVAFVIIPIFAFCNSGVALSTFALGSISLGIIFGLVIGKPLGVVGFAFIAKKTKIADLPKNVNWVQMTGLGFLAGVGFTMSLFISSLAFDSDALNNEAKIAIIMGSLISGTLGIILLLKPNKTAK